MELSFLYIIIYKIGVDLYTVRKSGELINCFGAASHGCFVSRVNVCWVLQCRAP